MTRAYAPNTQKLAWSPDGTLIAYLQGLEPKFNAYMQDRLFVVPATGGVPRALTDKLDRAVMSFAFTGESVITIAVEDERAQYPARVDVASGAITRDVPAGAFVVSALTSAGGHTALLQSNDNAPTEVYALEGGQLRKLTQHNDALLSELKLGAVEEIQFKSKDGTQIQGLIIKPPSFVAGRKYPMLLWIHGGPMSRSNTLLLRMAMNSKSRCLQPRVSSCCASITAAAAVAASHSQRRYSLTGVTRRSRTCSPGLTTWLRWVSPIKSGLRSAAGATAAS